MTGRLSGSDGRLPIQRLLTGPSAPARNICRAPRASASARRQLGAVPGLSSSTVPVTCSPISMRVAPKPRVPFMILWFSRTSLSPKTTW